MSENLSYIIILEFVAPFAILSVLLLIALLNGNKKNKKGLTQLLQGVQDGEKDYQQKLLEFFKKSSIKDSELDDMVHKFTRNRRAFFKQLLTALNDQDAEQLNGLGGQFNRFSDLYHQLEVATIDEMVEDADEAIDNSTAEANHKVVKRENKRLKAEVHVSVSALNGLFNEYASMFGEVPENQGELSVTEILEAMEKFTKGDFKPENVTKDVPPELEEEKPAAISETSKDSSTEEPGKTDTKVNRVEEDDEIAVEPESSDDPIEVAETDESSDEPDWGDAFEEAGDTPDESAVEQFEASQQPTSEEPDWGDAFEEAGDTPDEGAVEQFEASQQESASEPTEKSEIDSQKSEKKPSED